MRFGKIFTDAPRHDRPISFGAKEMCEICSACVTGCPSKAIPDGAPTAERYNRSNLQGVTKWSIDGERCFSYWTKINDCSICVRVCPFTRDYTSAKNRSGRLAGSPLRRLALWLDRRKGEALGVKLQRGGPHHQNELINPASQSSSNDRMLWLSSLFSDISIAQRAVHSRSRVAPNRRARGRPR